MPLPLEAVPNFSEGRDRRTIDAVGRALASGAELLDVHADADHNRSVFTVVGSEEELVTALLAGIACAVERIDLRRHEGAHPRIGAADVVPIVPIRPADMGRARTCALDLAQRVGRELELPVFLYGELAPGRGPAFFRRGGTEELGRRVASGELEPDFGPRRLHPSAGGVVLGARRPLIAFNVNLRGDVEVARRNVERNRHRFRARSVEVVTSDALDYVIPADLSVAYMYCPFYGEVFARVMEGLFASVDRHPRALRVVYNYPAEQRFLATSERMRLIDAVPGTWPRRSLSTPKTILTYLILPSDDAAATDLAQRYPPRLRGAECWLEPYDPGFGLEKPDRLGGKVLR